MKNKFTWKRIKVKRKEQKKENTQNISNSSAEKMQWTSKMQKKWGSLSTLKKWYLIGMKKKNNIRILDFSSISTMQDWNQFEDESMSQLHLIVVTIQLVIGGKKWPQLHLAEWFYTIALWLNLAIAFENNIHERIKSRVEMDVD